ncbi:hypothetical protein [Rhodococcus opacus]|uniref:hypothetical protein n=1 Tax=Rhodococcus opacus TaxID=37919 RepID=UPI00352EDF7F
MFYNQPESTDGSIRFLGTSGTEEGAQARIAIGAQWFNNCGNGFRPRRNRMNRRGPTPHNPKASKWIESVPVSDSRTAFPGCWPRALERVSAAQACPRGRSQSAGRSSEDEREFRRQLTPRGTSVPCEPPRPYRLAPPRGGRIIGLGLTEQFRIAPLRLRLSAGSVRSRRGEMSATPPTIPV